jgi:hypothetical protein
MIETFGLTHIALAVKSAKRAFEFYQQVFGSKKVATKVVSLRRKHRVLAMSWCLMKMRSGSENAVASNISDFDCSDPKILMLLRS